MNYVDKHSYEGGINLGYIFKIWPRKTVLRDLNSRYLGEILKYLVKASTAKDFVIDSLMKKHLQL